MDPKVLEPLLSARSQLPGITSVLAVRHGAIAFEHYFVGGRESLRSVHDVTKGVVACLVGIAIEQGLIGGVEQSIVDFFPQNATLAGDPRAQQVSLRHLLTMSDGIRAAGNMVHSYFSDAAGSQPLRIEPGSAFEDNFMSAQIISMILTRASGKSAFELAQQHLFEPLGITSCLWRDFTGMAGVSHGADGLALSSRDMAKIGYLLLREGTWDGRELVPASWVADCSRAQIRAGEPAGYFGQYGFGWWVYSFGTHPGFFALGAGGQVICVVPDLDLVAVVTGSTEESAGEQDKYLQLIEDHIVGAVAK